MITEQQQEQASLYVLGTMDAHEARHFARELRLNAELRGLVIELQRTVGLMAEASSQTPLPASLREKVMDRIATVSPPHTSAVPPVFAAVAGLRFDVAAEAAGWKPLPIPGAFIKLLSLEKERGYAVLLGKLEPGTRYPAHVNAGPEDFFILTGDLVVGDRKLIAGDYHHADGGSRHEENHSVDGCTLLAVLTTEDPLVAFAMA